MSDHRRIAKNTLFLYVRMLLIMGVSLYISRIILNALGAEDFGIYNVVGGFVAIFGFINGSMTAATQRYLSFAIAERNSRLLQRVFSTSIFIHICIAVVVLVLSETLGVWFLFNRMQIPADRIHEAFWVFQCSVAASLIMIMSVPFTAAIVSHERMGAFAYISILDVVVKLLISYVVAHSSHDRLVVYAVLLLLAQLLVQSCYHIYCNKNFPNCSFSVKFDKQLFREMAVFSGWTMNGNFAVVCYTQGLNVLLNLFFGPTVNAARAIAVQVQSAVSKFCQSFQMAVNPQITKTYAVQNWENMHNLVILSSKFSFYLVLMLSLPIVLRTNYILRMWLGNVPENTVVFTNLILCTSLLYTLSNPMVVSIHATGQLRTFQLVEGFILLAILPISYLILKYLGLPPFIVFVVHIVMEICAQIARVCIVLPRIHMKYTQYLHRIVIPISKTIFCAIVGPLMISLYLQDDSFSCFIVLTFACIFSVIISAYTVGCTANEKQIIKEQLNKLQYRIVKML